ncbi:MAG: transcriptional repressor NrdR [Chloroflexi bacterium]|nr:transcriptional repressor NrdR [Chloroflexota bacterium]
MKCPYCGTTGRSRVLDTGPDSQNGIRRRRECAHCGQRFNTAERAIKTTPLLIKGDGGREEFDRQKLITGIRIACAKRPVAAIDIDRLVSNIEEHLDQLGRSEVESRVVGDMVIEGLKALDLIAYIRYAIVYLGLDSLESVRKEIDHLLLEKSLQDHPDTSKAIETKDYRP